jgi:hypothetical protein
MILNEISYRVTNWQTKKLISLLRTSRHGSRALMGCQSM